MKLLQLLDSNDEQLKTEYEKCHTDKWIYTILAGENIGPMTNNQRIEISTKIALNGDVNGLVMLVPLNNGRPAWSYTISNISAVFKPGEEIKINIMVGPDVRPFHIEKGTPLCSAIICTPFE